MSDTHRSDLARWLDAATAGLPADTAESARAELAAHVEDAVAGYAEQGLSAADAQQRALADLGGAFLAEALYMLVITAHMLIWPLSTLLFFRVVYRPPFQPPQVAA
ncbi:MAG: hypothetical protein JXJ20_00810 [Anaerolineae bacterium]|nr:hypothetical protein [Anaerolineae bacterium]